MKLAKYGKNSWQCSATGLCRYFFKLFTVDNILHNKDKWLIILGKSYLNMRSSHNDVKSFVKQNSYHRMARTIWKEVKSSWQIPLQHQNTYQGGPESASIEIPLSDLTS